MKGKKKIKRNAVVIDQNFEQYLQNTYITQSRICSLHKVSMDNEGGGGFASPSPGKPKASREYSGDYLFVRINGNSIHCWYYLLSMANPISENRIVERSWTDARRIVERSWTDARRWIFTHKELKAPVNNTSKREPSKVPPLWERNEGRRSELWRKKVLALFAFNDTGGAHWIQWDDQGR